MTQEFTHIALSVPRKSFDEKLIQDVLEFYGTVFGWTKIERASIENERLILDLFNSGTDKYLNIRASDIPMTTTGYEHFGFSVDEKQEIEGLYLLTKDYAQRDARVEVGELEENSEGTYFHFKVRYLLPFSIEVQFWPGV